MGPFCSPITKEPDIVVEIGGRNYGLAVKRLKSISQLEKRFRHAAGQIENSRMPGFVMFDMMLAANPENEKLQFVLSERDFGALEEKRFEGFLKAQAENFQKWRRGREVRGVIVHDHVVCPVNHARDWGLRGYTLFMDLDPYNARRRSEAYAFWNEYKGSLPKSPGPVLNQQT